MSYDTWLQAPYMRESRYPLQCGACREYVRKDVEDFDGTVHCASENEWAIGTTAVGIMTPDRELVCFDCWADGKPPESWWAGTEHLNHRCLRCNFYIGLSVGVLMQDTSYDFAYDDPRL